MSDFSNYPEKYLLFNEQNSKNLAIVMTIEGIDDLYGISETFTQVRYGDPGLVFGLPGLVYGALRRIGGAGGEGAVKPYIILDTSMVIGQRIEPEQGKGNVGTLTMTLIDKNGEISRIISPGIVVDELIAKREVKIWLGFVQTSYPDDYLLVYRGYITSIDTPPGVVKFQISDSSSKKRQSIFNTPSTLLSMPIDDTETTLDVDSTTGLYEQILGPDGTYDPDVRTFIRIDDEIMEYDSAGILSSTQIEVTRGSLDSTEAAHELDAVVTNTIMLGDQNAGMNFIDLVLKLLLSGWAGDCETNVEILSFVYSYDITIGSDTALFVLKTEDAKKGLGLTVGDYFTITGATEPSNNVSGQITDIVLLGESYQIIYTDQTFVSENPSTAVVAFRSKYDTFPVAAGTKCRMRDVDVEGLEYIRDTYFTSSTTSNQSIYCDEPKFGKDVIDTDILLPMGCYGISRFGRVSMSVAKPPLPGIGKLIEVNWNNVLDPDKIHVTRATNNRNFFNLISFEYNKTYLEGRYTSLKQFIDLDSLNLFNQVSKLPITAPGLRDDIGGGTIAQNRGRALLQRYKDCAIQIELTVNWSVGSLIEVSDIVLLRDEGRLKIMNFETGERNLGVQLFEVIDRQYNITAGNVKLKLLGGLGFDVNSRFGLFSPSSLVGPGSTSELIPITPSFGQTTLAAETSKWSQFVGLPIMVHDYEWTQTSQSTIVDVTTGFIRVSPPLSFTPAEGDIVDIAPYPTSTDASEDALYKTLYAHFTPSIPVVAGVSPTQFTVSLLDAANMVVGNSVLLRNEDYSIISDEIVVADITGGTITLEEALEFTPDSSYTVEGVGFKDGKSFYRYS